MRILDIIVEADDGVKYYAIGDSHAEGIAHYGGKKWKSLAIRGTASVDPGHKAAISQIPKGSTVAVCLGCNDAGNEARKKIEGKQKYKTPEQVAQSVKSVVDAVSAAGLNAVPVLYPPSTKQPWYGSPYSQDIRSAIKAALPGAIDMAGSSLYDGVHAGAGDYKKAATAVEIKAPGTPAGVAQQPDKPLSAQSGEEGVVAVPHGRTGIEVADVQKALMALGYKLPKYGVDGIRGSETSAAVSQFQEDNGLTVDGDPGAETVARLNTMLKAKGIKIEKSTQADVKARAIDRVDMKELPQDSVTQGKLGQLLNFIASKESGGMYDMMMGGKREPKILDMTINELLKFQSGYNRGVKNHTAAAGRYQYMPDTLRGYATRMGVDPNKQTFSKEFQDKLAIYTMRYQCKLDSWLSGGTSDKEFLDKIAQVWAAIPKSSGLSAYHNVGGNRAGMSSQYALNTLQDIKTA